MHDLPLRRARTDSTDRAQEMLNRREVWILKHGLRNRGHECRTRLEGLFSACIGSKRLPIKSQTHVQLGRRSAVSDISGVFLAT